MKDFLLICDKNCATYKEVFPLFKQGIVSFGSPVKEYDGTDRKFGNHGWITTFPVTNKKKLILTATYDPEKYPKYDNYDAVEVGRVKDIPYDYPGTMGVPITIFDYDLDHVEIVGIGNSRDNFTPDKDYINPKKVLKTGRIVDGGAVNGVLAISCEEKPEGVVHYTSDNTKYLVAPYARVLIRTTPHPHPRGISVKSTPIK